MGAKKSKEAASEQLEAGSPLASPAGRAWLAGELAAAEREERDGPSGRGWANNEMKRAAIVERAEFLRGLVALLNPEADS